MQLKQSDQKDTERAKDKITKRGGGLKMVWF